MDVLSEVQAQPGVHQQRTCLNWSWPLEAVPGSLGLSESTDSSQPPMNKTHFVHTERVGLERNLCNREMERSVQAALTWLTGLCLPDGVVEGPGSGFP